MATIFTHGIVGGLIAVVGSNKSLPTKKLALICAVSAIVPDLDVVSFKLGIAYADFWGHRGFSHSILFALIWALVVSLCFYFLKSRYKIKEYFLIGLLVFFSTISHGLLDALTNGGLGVALLSPFDTGRIFFPIRPILVSPIGFRFFGPQGWMVIVNEFFWVIIPSFVFSITVIYLKRHRAHKVSK